MNPLVVYLIVNLVNGKMYVGKTSMTLHRRWICHVSEAKTTSRNRHFLNAIRKYGKDNFVHIVLEVAESLDELIIMEIGWIAALNTIDPKIGYNETKGGEGLSNPTDATRKKMSDAHKGKRPSRATRDKMSTAQRGKAISCQQRDVLRTIQSRRVGGFSRETGDLVVEFSSTIEAELTSEGFYRSSKISMVCCGHRPHHRDLVWRYLDEDVKTRDRVTNNKPMFAFDVHGEHVISFLSTSHAKAYVGFRGNDGSFKKWIARRRAFNGLSFVLSDKTVRQLKTGDLTE